MASDSAFPVFKTSFTESRIAFERRRLKTRRRVSARFAFLADDVFAISGYYLVARLLARLYHRGMIGHIEGDVRAIREGRAIISVGGLGYKVAVTRDTLSKLSLGKRASLWTHLAVRETALDLYGFMDEEELFFFDLLITVSGIGPKSALAIL